MLKSSARQSIAIIVLSLLTLFGIVACSTGSPTPTTIPSPTPTLAAPSNTPTTPSSPTPFKVTSIDMSVNPKTIADMACGTHLTVVYTATFHIAPNSPGGTVQFTYTVNNGRSSPAASITIAPGGTAKTYSFNWSGNLPADHTYPGLGAVLMTSPNQVESPMVGPTGMCR